jgi:hypothetical protein
MTRLHWLQRNAYRLAQRFGTPVGNRPRTSSAKDRLEEVSYPERSWAYTIDAAPHSTYDSQRTVRGT